MREISRTVDVGITGIVMLILGHETEVLYGAPNVGSANVKSADEMSTQHEPPLTASKRESLS